MSAIVTMAKVTQRDFRKRAVATGVAQFLTIPYSHFVEFARFCLDLTGTKYEEHGYAPGQHVLPLLKLRVGGPERAVSKTSSPSNSAGGKSNPTGVPALVLPDGEVVPDSWAIANHLFPTHPMELGSERHLFYDTELGPDSRSFAYHILLSASNQKRWSQLCTLPRFGTGWKVLWYLGGGSALTNMMKKTFKTDDDERRRELMGKLEQHFEKMSQIVDGRKGKYINGDDISVEDVAFCSLGACVVFPPLYCNGDFADSFTPIVEAELEVHEFVDKLRDTPAGKYILEFYEHNRRPQL